MTAGIYAFLLLEKEMEFTKKSNQATEARLRIINDQYDLIYASIDGEDLMTKFVEEHGKEMNEIRNDYEFVLDLDGEHLNVDTGIDDARNLLESRIGALHRKVLLFARINHILTPENVKEFFGRYRGSMNPGSVTLDRGDDNNARRFS